jgi:hypothetical protein
MSADEVCKPPLSVVRAALMNAITNRRPSTLVFVERDSGAVIGNTHASTNTHSQSPSHISR